jgi:hypothetical protein
MDAIKPTLLWRSAAALFGLMIGVAMMSSPGFRLAGWLLGWFCLLMARC